MKRILLALAVASTLSTAAFAADATVIKARTMVKTADGGRVGTIDRIHKDASGQPTSVQIIYKGRFVILPASTLSAGEKGLVTSLTAAEVNKL